MSDLIQALKNNEKPFGLMTEVMQAKAKELQRNSFVVFWPAECTLTSDGWEDHKKTSGSANVFVSHMTYRLRPDYEAKPDVVEIPVDPPSHSIRGLSFQKDGNIRPLYAGPEYPDFIGYKYEDDQNYIRPFIRMYRLKNSLGSDAVTRMYDKNIDKYEVLTPTHVLFKGESK